MIKRCVYCRNEIKDERAIDVCDRCGIGVWGEKMFGAIKGRMHDAKEAGNLGKGFIGEAR